MIRTIKRFSIAALLALSAAAIAPSFAQEATPAPMPGSMTSTSGQTITVSGIGTALGAPDTASLQVGVDVVNENIGEAFSQANTSIATIVAAVQAAGVAPDDIQTTNLNLYNEVPYDASLSSAQPVSRYRLSNTVSIIIRDITQVQAVIEAAIGAGATNLYGLSFSISEATEQETSARESAVADARARAEQLAGLVGAQLGDVIAVNETLGGFGVFPEGAMMAQGGGGGFVSPGQSTIQVQVQVTFALVR